MYYAAFTTPEVANQGDNGVFVKNDGFSGQPIKRDKHWYEGTWRLIFDTPLSSKAYLVVGKAIDDNFEDAGPVRVINRQKAGFDIIVPTGKGCILFVMEAV